MSAQKRFLVFLSFDKKLVKKVSFQQNNAQWYQKLVFSNKLKGTAEGLVFDPESNPL